MFKRKATVTEDRILAIENRIIELKEELNSKARSIDERKEDVAQLLGQMALSPKPEVEENLKSSKKSLEKMRESFSDLEQQIEFLQKEKSRLDLELCEALVRDIPKTLQKTTEEFNQILNQTLDALSVMAQLHSLLEAKEKEFQGLMNDRDRALGKLNRIEPLNGVGLGKLFDVGAPYSSAFSVGSDLIGFLKTLTAYKRRLEDFETFKKNNPSFTEDIQRTQKMDAERNKFPRAIINHSWTI